MIYSISTLIGILIFINKTTIKISNFEVIILVLLLFFITLFYKKIKTISIIIFIIFGYFWTLFFSTFLLHNEIEQKYHNNYVLATGIITSLVKINHYKDSFIFQTSSPFNAKLKLSIYGNKRPIIKTGDKWQFSIKIKNNNNYSNYGSFDYERWLFMRGIDATGYINIKKSYQFISQTNTSLVNQIRQKIRDKLTKYISNLEFFGLINAILIGDKSFITQKHKDILIKTGTTHLSVISGLHLGIIAGFIFLLSSMVLSRIPSIINIVPVAVIAAIFTIFTTFIYMALAGFSIPTMRAFIMIAVFMVAILFRLQFHKWQIYFFALFIVLLINPIAVLSIGFWLSFVAVGIILYVVNFNKIEYSFYYKIKNIIYLQIMITIIMFPFIIWFFNSFSLVAPMANIVAIPIFSILIVPLALIAILLLLLNFEYLAIFTFQVIDKSLHHMFNLLAVMIDIGEVNFTFAITSNSQFIAIIFIIVIAISHKILKLRLLAIIMAIAVFTLPAQKNNHFYILDVGQGI